jgi:stearoyl-CoA desaturase (delta-9 desaturase)
MALTQAKADVAPRNWPTTAMFSLTFLVAISVVPWYGFTHGYSAAAWIWGTLLLGANGMAITCGYHRLWAHRAYEAHPLLRLPLVLFGAMALQNSVLMWASNHRVHHRYIDDPERDPYCARRGFWFSHIGWMLRSYPSGEVDLALVRDLERDPIVAWQHRHYYAIALSMNLGLPLLIGYLAGDVWGVFLLAGVVRLVVSHHFTFFINSLAHMWGSQPYSDENTARDNPVVALLTYGEGYHNFHHMFAHDYRNGLRWWQWDPSKWFIGCMSLLGLARNLKRVPWFRIQRAMLDNQFQRAERRLASQPARAHIELIRARIAEEYEAFSKSVAEWARLREAWIEDTKRAVRERWQQSALQAQLRELEYGLRLQYRRVRVLRAQLG